MNDFSTILALVKAQQFSKKDMRRYLMAFLQESKRSGQLEDVVRSMILMMKTDQFLPEQYAKFQPVVMDSLVFILSQLSMTRLTAKVADQVCLPESTTAGKRLLMLIKDMPTLQKLGQVICRSPGLDPVFREALIDLEDNLHTVQYAQLGKMIRKEVQKIKSQGRIRPKNKILSEATVCAVIPADVTIRGRKPPISAVLKVVKPSVGKHLKSDMALWDKLTVFLDQNKASWGLREFNFESAFNQVRRLIDNEVDLNAEQQNLAFAAHYYGSDEFLTIPEVLPVSTPSMTVMTRVKGTKITSVDHLTTSQRRKLVKALTRICILKPLQDLDEVSIFHGDPHAGNIAYTFCGQTAEIILYDWAMMGRLSRLDRFLLALLTAGLIFKNPQIIYYASDIITRGQISDNPEVRESVMAFIQAMVAGEDISSKGFLTNIKTLFEELTYQGVTFSVNLMMFEKAAFTLDGVIADIDPEFEKNDYLAWKAMAGFIKDLIGMRFHRVILEEIWSFYQHNSDNLIKVQKTVIGSLIKLGFSGLKYTVAQLKNNS